MDRGPQDNQPHPSEIWLFLCEAEQGSGADSFVGRPWSSVGRGLVACHCQSLLPSGLSNVPQGTCTSGTEG